jgi:hypothetical protein
MGDPLRDISQWESCPGRPCSQWGTRWEILTNGRATRGDQPMRELACDISQSLSRLVRIANNIVHDDIRQRKLPDKICSHLELR